MARKILLPGDLEREIRALRRWALYAVAAWATAAFFIGFQLGH